MRPTFASARTAAPGRQKLRNMDTLVWIVTGGALGWMSYAFLGYNEARGVMVSVVIGAVGALIGAKALAPMLMSAAAPEHGLSMAVLAIAAGAALALLALGNLVHRRWGV